MKEPLFHIADREGITGFGLYNFYHWCRGTEAHQFEPENVFVNDEEGAWARHLELKAQHDVAEWAKGKSAAELKAMGILDPAWPD